MKFLFMRARLQVAQAVLLSVLFGAFPAWTVAKETVSVSPQLTVSEQSTNSVVSKEELPGVMDQHDLTALSELARRLSSDHDWLSPSVVKMLAQMDLRLDEVFQDAPEVFVLGEQRYRLKLEAVGPYWAQFNAKNSPYAVFLSQETYTGLGHDAVLGYLDGQERRYNAKELSTIAAVALSLHALDEDDAAASSENRWLAEASPEQGIHLGRFQPQVKRPEPNVSEEFAHQLGLLRATATTRAACVHQAPLSTCSAGVPVCATGQPYFVTNGVLIKTDHEGVLKGNPEIELFPLNADGTGTSPVQGTTTTAIFDGRNVIDAAGRTRYLPDINNNNQWYNVSDFALLSYTYGYTWYSFLVEQDDTTGVLKSTVTSVSAMNFTTPGTRYMVTINPFNFNFFKTVFKFVKGLIGSGNGDDIYAQPVGIGSALSCATLGSSAQNPFILDTAEWSMRGYYACIDAACIPLDATIQGSTQVPQYFDGHWSANVVGGKSPYSYRWYQDGQLVSSSSSVNIFVTSVAFNLELRVTDADGSMDSQNVWINPVSTCGQQICLPDY